MENVRYQLLSILTAVRRDEVLVSPYFQKRANKQNKTENNDTKPAIHISLALNLLPIIDKH